MYEQDSETYSFVGKSGYLLVLAKHAGKSLVPTGLWMFQDALVFSSALLLFSP